MAVKPLSPPLNDVEMISMGLLKPKKWLRRGSKNSYASSLSISVETFWAKMAILSASVMVGSIFGKFLIDFSSFARRSLASLLDIADAFKVLTLSAIMPLFPDEVDSMAYAMMRSDVGTVGGMGTFG